VLGAAPPGGAGGVGVASTADQQLAPQQGSQGVSIEQCNALLAELQQVKQATHTSHLQHETSVGSPRQWAQIQFASINNNIRRCGSTVHSGVVRQGAQQECQQDAQQHQQAAALGVEPGTAALSRTPRTLLELWQECKFGVGSQKPAEQFTVRERGNQSNGTKQKLSEGCQAPMHDFHHLVRLSIGNLVRLSIGNLIKACFHCLQQSKNQIQSTNLNPLDTSVSDAHDRNFQVPMDLQHAANAIFALLHILSRRKAEQKALGRRLVGTNFSDAFTSMSAVKNVRGMVRWCDGV